MIRVVPNALRFQLCGMRASIVILHAFLVVFTGCVSRSAAPLHPDDATILRKMVGEWEGSASI
ncbi:MAG: hypothetical protein JWO95_741, partial [Verrucomicrobiales bacterium]|nr:hypothetical protein [Verrucomicrobiales bacterium]